MLREPQVATLTEIRTSWSIRDVMDYNELLDMQDESSLRYAEHQRQEQMVREMQRSMR